MALSSHILAGQSHSALRLVALAGWALIEWGRARRRRTIRKRYRSRPPSRSDTPALGVVLYKTLSGFLPFRGTPDELVATILSQPPASLSTHIPDIPPALDSICLRCLAKDPNDRFQSAAEMAAALRQYMYPEEKAEQERRVRMIYRQVRSWRILSVAGILAAAWLFFGSGTIEIKPIDPGATVRLDGELVPIEHGQTSHTVPVGFGTHKISVSGPTFKDRSTQFFNWRRGEQRTVSASALLRSIDTSHGGKSVAGLCGSRDSSTIYAAYCGFPELSPVCEFDIETGRRGREYPFPDASFDHKGITISQNGCFVFVSNYHQKTAGAPLDFDRTDISRIDLQGNGEPEQLNVGGLWGTDLAATPDGRWLVVALGGDGRNKIEGNEAAAIVNIEDGRFDFVKKVPLDDEPSGGMLTVAPNSDAAYVVTTRRKSDAPKLYEIQLREPFEVTRSFSFPGGDLQSVAMSSERSRIFVADAACEKGVRVIDSETFLELDSLPLPGGYFPASLALHPQGNLLAVLCKNSTTIFLFDPRTSRLCTKLSGLDRQPGSMVFSPDGQQIWLTHGYPRSTISILDVSRQFRDAAVIFTSNREGEGSELYRMNADGSSTMRVSQHHGHDCSARWNRTGTQLAFISTRDGPPRIYVSDEFAQHVKCLESANPAFDNSIRNLDWSPDGQSIAYIDASYLAINTVDVATGAVKTLWQGPVEDHYDRHSSVSWNRVRDTIIFSTRNAATAEKYHDVFSLDPHAGTVKRLTDHRDRTKYNGFLAWPVVSPDGTRIAAVHMSRDLEEPPRDIWILNQDGTVLKTLHATDQQYCGPTSWSADSEYLYYSASYEPVFQRDLYRIRVDADQLEQLTCGEADDVDPDICPRHWGRRRNHGSDIDGAIE